MGHSYSKKKKKEGKQRRGEDMKFPGVFCIENIEHGVSRSDQGKKGNLNGFWLLAFGLGISKWLNNKDKNDKPTKSRVVLPKISSTPPPLPPCFDFSGIAHYLARKYVSPCNSIHSKKYFFGLIRSNTVKIIL